MIELHIQIDDKRKENQVATSLNLKENTTLAEENFLISELERIKIMLICEGLENDWRN